MSQRETLEYSGDEGQRNARRYGFLDMTRLLIIFPLALFLSVSPILASFAAYVCCCDGAPDNVHLQHPEDAHDGHNDGGDAALAQASPHSEDEGQRDRNSHSKRGADQGAGIITASSAHAGASAPHSCSCEQADDPAAQVAAISPVGKTSRKSTKMTSGHLASAVKLAEERLYLGTYICDAGDVSPPHPRLFLLNRALLI